VLERLCFSIDTLSTSPEMNQLYIITRIFIYYTQVYDILSQRDSEKIGISKENPGRVRTADIKEFYE